MARPKRDKGTEAAAILKAARFTSFEDLFGPSALPSLEDSPAAAHRPWVPWIRNMPAWDNKPPCPVCEALAVAPVAAHMADAPANALYCDACGAELDEPSTMIVAWAWFSFGAEQAYGTEPAYEYVTYLEPADEPAKEPKE